MPRNSERRSARFLVGAGLVMACGFWGYLLSQTAPGKAPVKAEVAPVHATLELQNRTAPDVLARLAAEGDWPSGVALRAAARGAAIDLAGTQAEVDVALTRLRALDTPVRKIQYKMRLLRSDAAPAPEAARRVQPPADVKPPVELARQDVRLSEGSSAQVSLAGQVDVQVKSGNVEPRDVAVRDAQISFLPRIRKGGAPGQATAVPVRPVVLTTRLVNRARTVFLLPAEVSSNQTLMVEMEAHIEPLPPVPAPHSDGVPR